MKHMHIHGILFDYGGTLDTAGVHWSEVLLAAYQAEGVQVAKEAFREAYVHGERSLAHQPLIRPEYSMREVLRVKTDLQMRYLSDARLLPLPEAERQALAAAVAERCYAHVQDVLTGVRPLLERLGSRYPMALVTNFYGNIQSVLADFRLDVFQKVVESAVVGVRKPDPHIFQLGVDALQLKAEEVAVVGDSFDKDIRPAATLGCKTVWYRGRGWKEEQVDEGLPTAIITNLQELTDLLL